MTQETTPRGAAVSPLSDEMLERFWERAPGYDAENRFFDEDFAELKGAGYLTLAVPKELGGQGLHLAEVCREQRRLGYFAAPTALAVNMHLYWTGVAADLWRAGDRTLEWLLKAAVAGEVFAAGHAESGNDVPALYSTARAEKVDGGYRFTGRKSFGSLTPVWTYLGVHGMDHGVSGSPKVVHAFMPRESAGVTIVETWDTLGMRATRSDDTVLDGVFVPDHLIARVVPAGAAGCSISRWRSSRTRPRSPSPGRWPTMPRSSTRWPRWPWPSSQSSLSWRASPWTGLREWTTAPSGPPRSPAPSTGQSRTAGGWWTRPST